MSGSLDLVLYPSNHVLISSVSLVIITIATTICCYDNDTLLSYKSLKCMVCSIDVRMKAKVMNIV